MSDDASYLSFLNSANKPPTGSSSGNAPSTSQKKSSFDPTVASSAVPAPLKDLDAYYTSDTDEPFEPVFLNYVGQELPDKEAFEKCLGGKGEVEELSVRDFDPRAEYEAVVEKVKQAGKGGVKVFRVGSGGTRCEYYVVSVGESGLVGVRAKAVES